MAKTPSKVGREAKRVKASVRQLVLHATGYKCGNPCCRYPLTLEIHHLLYASDGGADSADNLLPLCPTCHAEHHAGKIPTESLRAWKMLLLTLNEAFDRRSIDLLLLIAAQKQQQVKLISGDGVVDYAPLVASNLVQVRENWIQKIVGMGHGQELMYVARLTEKGQLFVEGWKRGDQEAAIPRGT